MWIGRGEEVGKEEKKAGQSQLEEGRLMEKNSVIEREGFILHDSNRAGL